MQNFKMKCMECSHEFVGDASLKTIVCPNCQKEIDTNMAIKYYSSLNKIKSEKTKIAVGEIYAKVNSLVEECKWYIDNEDYDKALEITDEALKLTNVDSNVYLMRVYAKTKNFTDYEDNSHYSDLKLAIEHASSIEKERIKKLYAPYYKKKNIPKEEFDEYENQEAISRFKRVEELLKDSIPMHFKREKTLKAYLIASIIFAVLSLATVFVSLYIEGLLVTLTICALLMLFIITFFIYIENKSKIASFNGVLDIYDNIESFNLSPKYKVKLAVVLELIGLNAINKESSTRIRNTLFRIIEVLIESKSESAANFLLNHKILKKLVEKEEQ